MSNNPTLIAVAERNMIGVVPLFYDMKKAGAEQLSPASIYKGLLLAYNGGNIGAPSNDITKIWNSGHITEEQLKVIKWLVMEVNFTIDYAKTLYKPTRPEWVNEIISKYTKAKVPHFFINAKNKTNVQVENTSACTVDRIEGLYPAKKLNFNFKIENIGRFDYRVLMNNPDIEDDPDVFMRYRTVVSNLNFNTTNDESMYSYFATYENAKAEIIQDGNASDIIDIIILNLFDKHKSHKKKAFWNLFGEEICANVSRNINENSALCKKCHRRFLKKTNRQIYCRRCQGYVKKKKKVIVCCDCGTEFVVNGNSRRLRCDDCRKKERSRINRNYRKKTS